MRMANLELLLSVETGFQTGNLSITEDELDWSSIYQQLVSRGCVWDFRDVFITAYRTFEPSVACKKVFGNDQPFEQILETAPTTATPDECTLLALLDIFISMALVSTVFSRPNRILYEKLLSLCGQSREHRP